MKEVLCAAINVYTIVLLVRVIFSWIPMRPGTGLASFAQVLAQLTEPLLVPLRRIIPPAGMFDLSFIVLFVLIQVLHGVIGCSGNII